jgi:fermentation-respiration switch protein FrsA (DUF1100 family)
MIEHQFIFFPKSSLEADPSSQGLAFEDAHFAASDGVQLHGWFVPGKGDVTWLWFHGNAGNISHRIDNLRLVHDQLGVNVFLFDYRGYGQSQGTPSEQGTYLDANAALAYVKTRGGVAPDRIVYFGRSLGSAIAVDLATRDAPYALILESPLPSIRYMARHAYPFLPVGPLLRTKYDTLAIISLVNAPLLVLHGDRDDIIPIDGGREVFEAAGGPKSFHTIEGAGHNDTYLVGGQPYWDALKRFMENLAF